jgi:hypothetical protein
VPDKNSMPDGLLARFDTTGAFDDKGSWSTFDQTQLTSNALEFFGAVFDGQYMYFVPYFTGIVTRFDARTPSSLPGLPGFYGSFY